MFHHRPGVQCQWWLTVSLSQGVLAVAHRDGARPSRSGDIFHSEGNAIVHVQCLPVHVQEVCRAPSTGEEQRVTSKARQRIAIATIGGQTNTETPGGYGWPIRI